jgi:serine phosphatase RsbU (regulator of sigma subunit)
MAVAGAGHPPAIHLNGEATAELGGGSMLGALIEPLIGEHEALLEPGDTLLLYTDGWMEAGPPTVHRGPESLAEMAPELGRLPVVEVPQRLRLDAITRGGGALRDDMVVLAVRSAVRPAAGSPARTGAGSAQTGQASPR